MKQISTGTGLCVFGLGIAVLGAAQLVGSKGGQAFAQTGTERRIVSASVFESNTYEKWGYRIWSDNVIEMKILTWSSSTVGGNSVYVNNYPINDSSPFKNWTQVDNGLTAFVPADVDASGNVDNGDVGQVLLNIGETQAGNPPPPIDCTINAPR